MPLTRLLSRWGGVLLGAALVAGGPAASSATPNPTLDPGAGSQVAATDGLPTNLALAMPITVPASTSGLITAELLQEYTAPDGVLTLQLEEALDRPIALGVDPMILASIRILGSSAPESAVEWLGLLEGADNETFSLAYADADVAALSQAGLTPITVPTDFVVDPALFPEEQEETEAPTASPGPSPAATPSPSPDLQPTVPDGAQLVDLPFSLGPVMWPREGSLVATDLPVFSAAEPVTTILDSGSTAYPRDAIPASATSQGLPVLVSKNDVSSLLRDAVSAPTDAQWDAAMAQLTSALAGWTGGRATVFATLDRDLPTSSSRLAQTLDALDADPSVTLTSVQRTLDETPVEVGIVDSPVPAERVAQLRSVVQTEPATTAFATVLEDPTLITGDQRRRMLALASNAWIDGSGDWPAAVNSYLAGVGELVTSVQVLESSTINLLSDTGDLPITVSNALPYPVTVSVNVLANTAILDVLDGAVAVTIEPESQGRAAVPVESIANGTAVLTATLTSPLGVPVGGPVYLTTNVEAGWETAFTWTVAVIVLLVFIVGILRTVARRRREREAE